MLTRRQSVVFLWALVAGRVILEFGSMWDRYSELTLVSFLLLVLAGLFSVLDASWSALRKRPTVHPLLAVAGLTVILGLGAVTPIRWMAAALRLKFSEADYVELVRRAEAGEEVAEFYTSQTEPEHRYFVLWSGLAAECSGVVHDASRTFPADAEDAFGRRVESTHLWGPWYYVLW